MYYLLHKVGEIIITLNPIFKIFIFTQYICFLAGCLATVLVRLRCKVMLPLVLDRDMEAGVVEEEDTEVLDSERDMAAPLGDTLLSSLLLLRGVDVGDKTALLRMGNLLALIWNLLLLQLLLLILFRDAMLRFSSRALLLMVSRSILGTLSSDGVIGDGVAEASRAVSGCCGVGKVLTSGWILVVNMVCKMD